MIKKLVVPYVSINSLHLKVPGCLSPRSQQPATCLYRTNPQPLYLFNNKRVTALFNLVVQPIAVRFGVGLHVHIQDRRPTTATRDFLDFSQLLRYSSGIPSQIGLPYANVRGGTCRAVTASVKKQMTGRLNTLHIQHRLGEEHCQVR